ncbi:uncharacterized protein IWZ02DRAFT_432972 [Phyllosticta citriasiana]|uniref:uncharacterized protein n=1 Tax=Phyllosticta citriasiana TaxID=595635 RepID=UPI0030FDC9EC
MVNQQELATIRRLFGEHEAQLWSEGRGHTFVRDSEGEMQHVRSRMFDEMRRQQQQQQRLTRRTSRQQRRSNGYDADVESNEDSSSESGGSDDSGSDCSVSSDDHNNKFNIDDIDEASVALYAQVDVERLDAARRVRSMNTKGKLTEAQIAVEHEYQEHLQHYQRLAEQNPQQQQQRRLNAARRLRSENLEGTLTEAQTAVEQKYQDYLQHYQQLIQQRQSASPVELEVMQHLIEMPTREQPLSTEQLLFIAQEFGEDEAHRWYEGRGSNYARNRNGDVVLIRSALFEEFRLQDVPQPPVRAARGRDL